MPRIDISENLVHFTRDDSIDKAFDRLRAILRDQHLIAGNRYIRGGHTCVCFSEAPLHALQDGLVNPDYYSSYSPFGIMVSKKWLFSQGGRPVVYQSDAEYESLPDVLKWRHVRYEPNSEPSVDFTWEREWRIRTEALRFGPDTAAIVVQDQSWAQRLVQEHEIEQDYEIQLYSLVLDEQIARLMLETPFQWRIVTLR